MRWGRQARVLSFATLITLASFALSAQTYAPEDPSAIDYASITRANQPGDDKLRCTQIALMIGQMNDIVAQGTHQGSTNGANRASHAMSHGARDALSTAARRLLPSLGGMFGDAASLLTDGGAAETTPRVSADDAIKQAASIRRDTLLALARAKNCSGGASTTQATSSGRAYRPSVGDRAAPFPQRNSYPGGIEDCSDEPCSSTPPANPVSARNRDPSRSGSAPFKQENSFVGSFECTVPGQRCSSSSGTDLDPALRAAADSGKFTLQDVLRCNGFYTLVGNMRGDPDLTPAQKAGIDQVKVDTQSRNPQLWELIAYLDPNIRNAADQRGMVERERDGYMNKDVFKYYHHPELIGVDNGYCTAKGLFSR